MPYGETITDAELDIMNVLWENGASTSPAIFEALKNGRSKNRGTLKTLLARLVQKGAVRCEKINARNYLYIPIVTKDEYINQNRKRLIDRVFNGSVQESLLNFIKEENVTREDLEKIIKQIEED